MERQDPNNDGHAEVCHSQSTDRILVFPNDFIWGTATAAYQIEGAWNVGGRGMSIWDVFSRNLGGDTGDVACDHYFRYENDVKLMQGLGFKNYRLSISWPRIQPNGKGTANQEGISFYNRLFDCLLAHGIEPIVTLYHWDLPDTIEVESNGWLGSEVISAFVEYARICFSAFGDRIKKWITFNEPWCICVLGYGNGEHAPGIKSDDGSKVYLAAHNLLLAHAKAVNLYRKQFQSEQNGFIGITLNGNWSEPIIEGNCTLTKDNEDAAERMRLWSIGWFADPIWLGDYPEAMKRRCGDRLPSFTVEEKALLHGSSDFFGLNHYSTDFVKDCSEGIFTSHWGTESKGGYFGDYGGYSLGHPDWSRTDMGWTVVPWGFKKLLLWCHQRYKPTGGIYVTENGCAVDDHEKHVAENDGFRVSYFASYIASMHEAMDEGADVRAYFAWSFMDNFEWSLGYSKRFGIVHVDYKTQERTPKASAKWFSTILDENAVRITKDIMFLDAAISFPVLYPN